MILIFSLMIKTHAEVVTFINKNILLKSMVSLTPGMALYPIKKTPKEAVLKTPVQRVIESLNSGESLDDLIVETPEGTISLQQFVLYEVPKAGRLNKGGESHFGLNPETYEMVRNPAFGVRIALGPSPDTLEAIDAAELYFWGNPSQDWETPWETYAKAHLAAQQLAGTEVTDHKRVLSRSRTLLTMLNEVFFNTQLALLENSEQMLGLKYAATRLDGAKEELRDSNNQHGSWGFFSYLCSLVSENGRVHALFSERTKERAKAHKKMDAAGTEIKYKAIDILGRLDGFGYAYRKHFLKQQEE